jgi:hypothetical protein
MDLLIVLGALVFLMFVAYRGYSVILFAPIAALGAVLLTDPSLVPPMFSSVFMEKMVGFVKNYFPVFMLGKYPARSIASYSGHGERWHGYITSQRRRHHAACRYGSHPQTGL